MTLLTTERLLWHCGAHIAEPKIGDISPIPPTPYYQNLLFSVARGPTGFFSVSQYSRTCWSLPWLIGALNERGC